VSARSLYPTKQSWLGTDWGHQHARKPPAGNSAITLLLRLEWVTLTVVVCEASAPMAAPRPLCRPRSSCPGGLARSFPVEEGTSLTFTLTFAGEDDPYRDSQVFVPQLVRNHEEGACRSFESCTRGLHSAGWGPIRGSGFRAFYPSAFTESAGEPIAVIADT